jgi:hypothetical protein
VKASTLWAGSTALLLACIACGGQAETADTLDPSAPAFSLSTGQQKLFCDWVADQYGGYGESIMCDGGLSQELVTGPDSQADCVAQFMQGEGKFKACPANLGQVQTCLKWEIANTCVAQPGTPPDACTVVNGPLCSAS